MWLVVALAGGLGLVAGCGGASGIAKETFIDGFVTKSGLSRDQAVCVTDHLFRDLSVSEIRTIHGADDWETLSPKEQQAIVTASTSCLTPGASPGTDGGSGTPTTTGDVTSTGTEATPTTETPTDAPVP